MRKLVATTGLALAVAMPAAAQDAATAKAEFVNMAGEKNGTATLTETAQGVLIELEVTGLPAGELVAFHVHETGKCDHQTGHDSAGGHFNPTNAEHGYLTGKGRAICQISGLAPTAFCVPRFSTAWSSWMAEKRRYEARH